MFSYDSNLISINLSNFDTSNVENMKGVFYSSGNIKYFKFMIICLYQEIIILIIKLYRFSTF